MSVLTRIREWSQVPILVVSVRGREDDKIKALDSGANDYITKPFSTGELLARLRVVQRYSQHAPNQTIFSSGDLQVDLAARTVKVRGRTVRLTVTEYSLLHFHVRLVAPLRISMPPLSYHFCRIADFQVGGQLHHGAG